MNSDELTLGDTPARCAPKHREFSDADERHLKDILKRCSSRTISAACEFRRTREPQLIPTVIGGLIERYADREAKAKLQAGDDSLRLTEDLALDSLTLLEIVFLAEEVLQIAVDNEELRPFQTVGDVKAFVASKFQSLPA